MMVDGVQAVVDALAARLGRSVAVDDPAIRLIAASRHFGDEDQLRVRSVLDREVPSELQKWVLGAGIATWTKPGIVTGSVDFSFAPRLCFPVRCNGMLLGFLWLIESVQRIEDVDRDLLIVIEDAVDAIAVILYRNMLVHERERAQAESALRLLLSPDKEDRFRAYEEIKEDRLLADMDNVVVLVAQLDNDPGANGAVALEAAAEQIERRLAPRSVLTLVRRRRVILLVSSARPLGETATRELADQLRHRFFQFVGSAKTRLVVGIGTSGKKIESAADSYRQAMTAIRAALLLPMFGDVASWASLGPFALLLRIDFDELTEELPFPAVRDLLADPDNIPLVESLEEFLDRAGDVARTSAALHVHRTTLYHRLKRVETITGLSLDNGLDRLSLHLALKLSRINSPRNS